MTWRSIAPSGTKTFSGGHLSAPRVRKDHITDWITSNTSKNITLQSYSIEQLAVQVTGDIAIDFIELTQRGLTAQAPKARPIDCGSRTRGLERTARGKSSVACPRR